MKLFSYNENSLSATKQWDLFNFYTKKKERKLDGFD